jgi:hypothetical protein
LIVTQETGVEKGSATQRRLRLQRRELALLIKDAVNLGRRFPRGNGALPFRLAPLASVPRRTTGAG